MVAPRRPLSALADIRPYSITLSARARSVLLAAGLAGRDGGTAGTRRFTLTSVLSNTILASAVDTAGETKGVL